MAIVVETLVLRESKAEASRFDESIVAVMMQLGGPPVGLLVYFARPSSDGLLLCNVGRSEAELQPFYDDVILPQTRR